MCICREIEICSGILSLAMLMISRHITTLIGIGALFTFIVSAILTLIFMTLAANREAGPGYAARQLLLALLLTPVGLLGLLLIPYLVEADLVRTRLTQRDKSPIMFR